MDEGGESAEAKHEDGVGAVPISEAEVERDEDDEERERLTSVSGARRVSGRWQDGGRRVGRRTVLRTA